MPVKSAEYRVVINDRRRYSLWLAHKSNPAGWYDAGMTGPEPECVAFIESRTHMARTPEPELMLDEEQASAYAGADLSELHEPMLARFRERFPLFSGSRILDLGCGSADITIVLRELTRALLYLGSMARTPCSREGRMRFHAPLSRIASCSKGTICRTIRCLHSVSTR